MCYRSWAHPDQRYRLQLITSLCSSGAQQLSTQVSEKSWESGTWVSRIRLNSLCGKHSSPNLRQHSNLVNPGRMSVAQSRKCMETALAASRFRHHQATAAYFTRSLLVASLYARTSEVYKSVADALHQPPMPWASSHVAAWQRETGAQSPPQAVPGDNAPPNADPARG